MRLGHRLPASLGLTVLLLATLPAATGIQPLADPIALFVTGTGAGTPELRTFDVANTTAPLRIAHPFATPTSGVRVAIGDINGDGAADLVAGAGSGGAPQVKVLSGVNGAELMSFAAYDAAVTGGVFVAAGDVTGDGRADIVTGPGDGAPLVKVFDGRNGAEVSSFLAYGPERTGGVRVATGNVNADNAADIVTGPGPGVDANGFGPNVKVFDGATRTQLASVISYANGFRGGVFVAAGDLNGDGSAEVITGAGAGTFPQVKMYVGSTLVQQRSWMVHESSFRGGVQVAVGDLDDNDRAEIVTGLGAGAESRVKIWSGETFLETGSFLAYGGSDGVFVAAGPAGKADVAPTIEGLITMAQAALADGRLAGAGPGRSADGRAGAWMNMLNDAQTQIAAGNTMAACDPLTQAQRRVDGGPQPPDFVAGSGASAIAGAIAALKEELGC